MPIASQLQRAHDDSSKLCLALFHLLAPDQRLHLISLLHDLLSTLAGMRRTDDWEANKSPSPLGYFHGHLPAHHPILSMLLHWTFACWFAKAAWLLPLENIVAILDIFFKVS